MNTKTLRCGRCQQRAPQDLATPDTDDWSGQWKGGRLVLVLCPRCQTPTESAEAEANAAELQVGTQDGGRFIADPVICMTGTADQPGAVLYGRDHLQRVAMTRQAENIRLIEQLPEDTQCTAVVGGVMIWPPA